MRDLTRRLLDIRRGEWRLVLQSTLTLSGLIAAHTLLETARDTLFLTALDADRLPYVYGLLAGLAFVASRSNSRFVDRFGRRNALIFTLFFAAYGTVVFYLLPSHPWTYFGLYVFSGLLGTLLPVQFWMFAGRRFTVSQAKRLFGAVAAGGVLGAIAGAVFAFGLLSYLPTRGLLLAAAALLVLTALGVTTLPIDDPSTITLSTDDQTRNPFELFRKQPYLTRLAVLVALATAVVLTTDYLFKTTAAQALPPEQMGPFFAQYYAALNVLALLVQVGVAGFLLQRVGVISAYLVLPALLICGAGAIIVSGGALTMVLLAKGADGALRHSLHRITSELLWMPLSEQIRTQSKILVDSVVARTTQALTAAGLLALGTWGMSGPREIAFVIFGLAMAWLTVAAGLKRPYLQLFRTALTRPEREVQSSLQLDLRSVEVVVEALSSTQSARAIAAIDVLVASQRTRLIPALILYHESEDVLLRALTAMATPDRTDWIPLGERLLTHPSDAIRIRALSALARVGHREAIEARMLDVSPSVRAHAAFWLAESDPSLPERHPAITEILDIDPSVAHRAHGSLLQAIVQHGGPRWAEVILHLPESGHPNVGQLMTQAMGRAKDERFIPRLLERLTVRTGRHLVETALVDLGPAAFAQLEAALQNSSTLPALKRRLPAAVGRFSTRSSVNLLTDVIEKDADGRVRYQAIRSLCRLAVDRHLLADRRRIEQQVKRNLIEYLRLDILRTPLVQSVAPSDQPHQHLLSELLSDKAHQALERSFLLLQIVHPKEDLRTLATAVKTGSKQLRAQALEFLEALNLDAPVAEIRDLFRWTVDDLATSERAQRAAAYLPELPSTPTQVLKVLQTDPDPVIRKLADLHSATSSRKGTHA